MSLLPVVWEEVLRRIARQERADMTTLYGVCLNPRHRQLHKRLIDATVKRTKDKILSIHYYHLIQEKSWTDLQTTSNQKLAKYVIQPQRILHDFRCFPTLACYLALYRDSNVILANELPYSPNMPCFSGQIPRSHD